MLLVFLIYAYLFYLGNIKWSTQDKSSGLLKLIFMIHILMFFIFLFVLYFCCKVSHLGWLIEIEYDWCQRLKKDV